MKCLHMQHQPVYLLVLTFNSSKKLVPCTLDLICTVLQGKCFFVYHMFYYKVTPDLAYTPYFRVILRDSFIVFYFSGNTIYQGTTYSDMLKNVETKTLDAVAQQEYLAELKRLSAQEKEADKKLQELEEGTGTFYMTIEYRIIIL